MPGLSGLASMALTGLTGNYYRKVLFYDPIAYWPLWERAGLSARCLVNPTQNGTYTGVSLANATGPDGNPCPWFDGTNDTVNIFTTALRDALNGSQGSAIIWAKVNSVANWTDGTSRQTFYLRDNGYANLMNIRKNSVANEIKWLYYAGGTAEEKALGGNSDTGWMCWALTWDKAGDAVLGYKNGAQVVSADTLGNWGGPITKAYIGTDIAAGPWHGWLAHCAIFDRTLTPGEVADLAT